MAQQKNEFSEHMSFEFLELLRKKNPAWRLLASSQAPFVAAFLYREFIAESRRLVYYRVRPEVPPQSVSGQPHPLAVSEKLKIKPNTPFGIWLTRELRQRFAHVCCESREQFSREMLAITQGGQIKSKGNRHEKDDRYAINDRRRYILGFSNQKKIDVLAASEQELQEEVRFYRQEIIDINKKQTESQERLNAVECLEGIKAFADIDTHSKEEEIGEKEERRKKLEQGSDV